MVAGFIIRSYPSLWKFLDAQFKSVSEHLVMIFPGREDKWKLLMVGGPIIILLGVSLCWLTVQQGFNITRRSCLSVAIKIALEIWDLISCERALFLSSLTLSYVSCRSEVDGGGFNDTDGAAEKLLRDNIDGRCKWCHQWLRLWAIHRHLIIV